MEDKIVTQSGATCWHYERMPFTEEVAAQAERELNERPEDREQEIARFRQMIIERADFRCPLDDDYLLRFLRPRKFDKERAFRLLRNFYGSLVKYPELVGDAKPSTIKEYLLQFSSTVLPYRDTEGRTIILLKFSEWNAERTPFPIAVRMVGMATEVFVQDPVNQVKGVVAILDFRNTDFRFLRHVVTPSNMYIMFTLLQECFPGRIKDKHLILGSTIGKIAYNVAKLFMNAKMKRRFVFHDDKMRSLTKYFPVEILPEEYGGSFKLDKTVWVERLLSMEPVLTEQLTWGFRAKD